MSSTKAGRSREIGFIIDGASCVAGIAAMSAGGGGWIALAGTGISCTNFVLRGLEKLDEASDEPTDQELALRLVELLEEHRVHSSNTGDSVGSGGGCQADPFLTIAESKLPEFMEAINGRASALREIGSILQGIGPTCFSTR